MKASAFLDGFQRSRGVTLTVADGRLAVHGPALSTSDKVLIAMHADQLIAVLSGKDSNLTPAISHQQAQKAGFILMDRGSSPSVWTHPAGDDYAEQVLSGLIAFPDAVAVEKEGTRKLAALAHTGRPVLVG